MESAWILERYDAAISRSIQKIRRQTNLPDFDIFHDCANRLGREETMRERLPMIEEWLDMFAAYDRRARACLPLLQSTAHAGLFRPRLAKSVTCELHGCAISRSVPPKLYGGTERVVAWLINELIEFGHEVTLFASGDSVTRAKPASVWPRALRLSRPATDPMAAQAVCSKRWPNTPRI